MIFWRAVLEGLFMVSRFVGGIISSLWGLAESFYRWVRPRLRPFAAFLRAIIMEVGLLLVGLMFIGLMIAAVLTISAFLLSTAGATGTGILLRSTRDLLASWLPAMTGLRALSRLEMSAPNGLGLWQVLGAVTALISLGLSLTLPLAFLSWVRSLMWWRSNRQANSQEDPASAGFTEELLA